MINILDILIENAGKTLDQLSYDIHVALADYIESAESEEGYNDRMMLVKGYIPEFVY